MAKWYVKHVEVFVELLERRCGYCGCDIATHRELAEGEAGMHCQMAGMDHMVPRCRGGPDHVANLMIACGMCNSLKGATTLEEFRALMADRASRRPKFTQRQIEWLREQGVEIPASPRYTFWFEALEQRAGSVRERYESWAKRRGNHGHRLRGVEGGKYQRCEGAAARHRAMRPLPLLHSQDAAD